MRLRSVLLAFAGTSALLASCTDPEEPRRDATPIASTATASAIVTPDVAKTPAPTAQAPSLPTPVATTPLPTPAAEATPLPPPVVEPLVAPVAPPPVSAPNPTQAGPVRAEPPPPAPPPPSPQVRSTAIRDLAFTEPVIEVSVGSTVVWTNLDGIAHTVTSADSMLDSPFLSNAQTYSMMFPRAGVFPYFCRPHLQMTGIVIVRE